MSFNESENDWESSESHKEFNLSSIYNVKTLKLDTLVKKFNFDDYSTIIKLDIEGAETKALEGAFNLYERYYVVGNNPADFADYYLRYIEDIAKQFIADWSTVNSN